MIAIRGAVVLLLLVASCRQGDPQEPRMPPNSPIPDIDRPKDTTPGPMLLGDAGPGAAAPRAPTR